MYDKNGNLTTDPYKGLTIQYNFLNLPKLITKGGANITIRYDVSGRKWSQSGTEGIREYVGGIEYVDQKIQSVQHGEGRLVAAYNAGGTAIESIRAEYWRQDHLGNVRVAFSDFNQDGVIVTKDDPNNPENDVEITQENHYYPFGLNHEGPWYQTVASKNKYQYNGKEYVEDLGLNWNDYGARWYDAAVGRWFSVDPLADKFKSISPYNYVLNNPVVLKDLDGFAPCPPGTPCDNPLPEMRIRQNRASNLGPGNVRNNNSRFHSGHDLYASTGTRVNSVMTGKVIATGSSSSYGNYITIQHTLVSEEEVVRSEIFETEPEGDIYYTFYAHLSQVSVEEGDEVGVGEQIGLSGTTGNASGMTGNDEHLHFEVGTNLRNDGELLDRNGLVDPNFVYNGILFLSADPNANQTTTGVIKITVNGVMYQPAGNPSGDVTIGRGRDLLDILFSIINNLNDDQ